ncbi:hypothetical protein B5G09_09410 [Alistipes sp. An54]|nr:hypothetical protein B5G09_09410 [Alistipes sp. An54]
MSRPGGQIDKIRDHPPGAKSLPGEAYKKRKGTAIRERPKRMPARQRSKADNGNSQGRAGRAGRAELEGRAGRSWRGRTELEGLEDR